jgi:hypothetical protein
MNNKYLNEGKQTKITEAIEGISNNIEGSNIEYIFNVLVWMRNTLKTIPEDIEKNSVFRKRTADEIMRDGYASGCTDYALVFIALSRAKGIPAKYVEAIKCNWLEDPNARTIGGHIFVECLLNDKWVQVDPQRGTIHAKTNYNGFEIFDEGLDSWDIGISDFDSLKQRFEDYKRSYNR